MTFVDTRSPRQKHRGPAQRYVLDGPVILLRKVNFKKIPPGIIGMIQQTNLRPKELEGDQPWFPSGYVAAEQPRNLIVSKALLDATLGYAIADNDTGEILREFKKSDYIEADAVHKSAKVGLRMEVDLEPDAEDDEDEDDA